MAVDVYKRQLRNYAEHWWPWFRLGEIYLNAAAAAFALNDEPTALPYINRLRQLAGFPANSLTSLTIEMCIRDS